MAKNAKDWLNRLKYSRNRVEDLTQRIAQLEAQATRITSVITGDIGSSQHRPDRMACTIASMMDAKAELERQLAQQLQLQHEVEAAINAVSNADQREVLYQRYVMQRPFDEIAQRMGISERYAHTLHGYALLRIKVP